MKPIENQSKPTLPSVADLLTKMESFFIANCPAVRFLAEKARAVRVPAVLKNPHIYATLALFVAIFVFDQHYHAKDKSYCLVNHPAAKGPVRYIHKVPKCIVFNTLICLVSSVSFLIYLAGQTSCWPHYCGLAIYLSSVVQYVLAVRAKCLEDVY